MIERLPLLLVACAMGLVLLLVAAVKFASGSENPEATQAQPNAEIAVPEPVAFSIKPIDQMNQTRERPLFYVNRREPPKVPTDATALQTPVSVPVEVPSEFKLSAVVITDEKYTALLTDAAGGMQRVQVGQEIGGWTLKSVNADSVTLQRGAKTQEVQLRTFETPVATPSSGRTPAAPPRRRTAANTSDGSAEVARTREQLRERMRQRAERRARALERAAEQRAARQERPGPVPTTPSAATSSKDCGLSRC
ncbi:MAG: hypothetical protein K0U93_05635 [Gammaproteobacteria bacterium]|nr:hypothetical protein [Gammaproteobacteria bacterium]